MKAIWRKYLANDLLLIIVRSRINRNLGRLNQQDYIFKSWKLIVAVDKGHWRTKHKGLENQQFIFKTWRTWYWSSAEKICYLLIDPCRASKKRGCFYNDCFMIHNFSLLWSHLSLSKFQLLLLFKKQILVKVMTIL